MYIGIGQGPQHQTCTFEICNFHFHYGRNLTSTGMQVKSMQNVNCTLKIVEKYYIKWVLGINFEANQKSCTLQLVIQHYTLAAFANVATFMRSS